MHLLMKNLRFVSLLLLVGVMFGVVAQATSAEIGEPAPDFSLTDIDGRQHTLSEYRGKTVVLEWVNPLCPFVVKNYERSGNIPKLQQAAMADGVVWLIINSGHPGAEGDYSPEEAKAWLSKNNSTPSAYLRDQDGTVGRLYGAKTTPHMYVITPEGTLVYNGAIDSIRSANPADIAKAENYVKSALAAVSKGEAVATPVTRPYGCSVKY